MLRSCLLSLIVFSMLVTAADVSDGTGEAAGGVAHAPSQAVPLPGDPAPPLNITEWLQKGVYDKVRPVDGRLITVIEFWASWDPRSRYLLPLHDTLQGQLQRKGVRFVAISQESPEQVGAYLEQAKLKHVAVACDKGGEMLGPYGVGQDSVAIPYAVILSGTDSLGVLWAGPVVRPNAKEDSTGEFLRVLGEAAEGRFDARVARENEVRQRTLSRELGKLQEEWQGLVEAGKLDELRTAARAAPQQWHEAGGSWSLPEALASTAALLVQDAAPDSERSALGLELVEAAMAGVDEANCDLFHLYGEALFLTGRPEAAVEAEESALASFDTAQGVSRRECQAALARYRDAVAKKRGEPIADQGETHSVPPEEDVWAAPPDVLTLGEAVDDLTRLYGYLRQGYVGYDDAAWSLAATGLSWERRNAEFLSRTQARHEWPLADFLELLKEYLSCADDRHLFFQVVYSRTEWRDYRPRESLAPWFSDVRVRAIGERMCIVEAPQTLAHLLGAEALAAPVIADPGSVQTNQPYLFPTLPRVPGEREYLLGVLGMGSAPPTESVVLTRGASGMAASTAFPLHRGRVRLPKVAESPWWSVEAKPVPVLAVRSAVEELVKDMPGTADMLSAQPLLVLDLRGNGGGSDGPALEWCGRFTGQPLTLHLGGASFYPGQTDPLLRWDPWLTGQSAGRQTQPEPDTLAYAGRLFVVADNVVASSGESFLALASQIKGAAVVGENTAGCATYGNVDRLFHLPHCRATIVSGRTKFIYAGRPFREGVGFFPDYWLDTEDPVKAIVEYLSAS